MSEPLGRMRGRKTANLRTRLVGIGVALALGPAILTAVVARTQIVQIIESATADRVQSTTAVLNKSAEQVFATLPDDSPAQMETLRIAKAMLLSRGGLSVPQKRVRIQITDDANGQTSRKSFALGIIGWKRNGYGRDLQRPVPDEVHDVTGAQCAVYQRMDPAGNMLRLASTAGSDGKRGAYHLLPVAGNTSIASVLNKRTAVAGTTLYDPILRSDGEVIGMLAVTVPNSNWDAELDAALRNLRSANGIQILDASVPNSIARAARQHPDTWVDLSYTSGDGTSFIARARYLSARQRIIGVAARAPRSLDFITARGVRLTGLVLLLTVLLAGMIWFFSARFITRPIVALLAPIYHAASRLVQAANSFQSVAEQLGAGRSHSSVERGTTLTTSAAESAKLLVQSANQAVETAKHSDKHTGETTAHLTSMHSSMEEISASNTKIAAIMNSVDEIAFQSRILALNAAIEAARAGEAGVSFAVVADEFGVLAKRCAEAASSTTEIVSSCMSSTAGGRSKLEALSSSVKDLATNTLAMRSFVETVQSSAREQLTTSNELAKVLTEVGRTIEANEALAGKAAAMGVEIASLSQAVRGETVEAARALKNQNRAKAMRPAASARRAVPAKHLRGR